MKACQYVHFFIYCLLVVPQTIVTELYLYLKCVIYLTLKPQKFHNCVLYCTPVHLWSHIQCSLLHIAEISRLQAGSKKVFRLCLLMWLLSCWYSNHKRDVIITMSSFRLLKPQSPLSKAAFELNPLHATAVVFIFTCWDSHSLYSSLLILGFTQKFCFCWSFSY